MNTIKIKNALLFFAASVLLATGNTQAQITPQQKDDIEARRIGFITKELQLTPQEAQVFWPVYNRYHDDLETIRKTKQPELLEAKVNFDSYTDEQVSKMIDAEMNERQKELDLQTKYNAEFKKVLPVKKVARLYRAEQQFKINLIRDMKQNPGQGSHSGGTPNQQRKMPNQ